MNQSTLTQKTLLYRIQAALNFSMNKSTLTQKAPNQTIYDFTGVAFNPKAVSGFMKSVLNRAKMFNSANHPVCFLSPSHTMDFLEQRQHMRSTTHNMMDMRCMPLDLCGRLHDDSNTAHFDEQAIHQLLSQRNFYPNIEFKLIKINKTNMEIRSAVDSSLIGKMTLNAHFVPHYIDMYQNNRRQNRTYFDLQGKILLRNITNNLGAITSKEYFNLDGECTLIQTIHQQGKDTYLFNNKTETYTGDIEGLLQIWLSNLLNNNEIVITEWLDYPKVFAQLRSSKNIKHIVTVHTALFPNSSYLTKPSPMWQTIMANTKHLSALVLLCEEMRTDFCKLLGSIPDNISVIKHFIPEIKTDPTIQRNPKLCVMVCRIDLKAKNFQDAIAVFNQVSAKDKEAVLEIYGAGTKNDEDFLKNEIKKANNPAIRFMGPTSEPHNIYAKAAVSLFTSRYEGFSLSLAESLKIGCVPAAYAFKYGARDQIINGKNGLITQWGNIDELADAVYLLLNEPKWREELSDNAKKLAQSYSFDDFKNSWLNIIEACQKTS